MSQTEITTRETLQSLRWTPTNTREKILETLKIYTGSKIVLKTAEIEERGCKRPNPKTVGENVGVCAGVQVTTHRVAHNSSTDPSNCCLSRCELHLLGCVAAIVSSWVLLRGGSSKSMSYKWFRQWLKHICSLKSDSAQRVRPQCTRIDEGGLSER